MKVGGGSRVFTQKKKTAKIDPSRRGMPDRSSVIARDGGSKAVLKGEGPRNGLTYPFRFDPILESGRVTRQVRSARNARNGFPVFMCAARAARRGPAWRKKAL